jgi:hypothetical protein
MNDDDELEALERELPALTRIGRFTRGLDAIPWFSNLGEPLTAGTRAAAQTYTDGLGFPDSDVAVLIDWDDAMAAAESLGWQSSPWEAEELLRADLTARALNLLSEDALKFAMTLISERVTKASQSGMEEAAALFDIEDEEARNLAVGAAVQAAHQAALVLIAAGGDPEFDGERHPFAAKFKLFEYGRWPVGVAGSTFNLF